MPAYESTDSTRDAGREPGGEAQLEAVIAHYIQACEMGAPLDRRRLLREHPQWADELREFFKQRDRMHRMAEPIREFGESLLAEVEPGQRIRYVGNYELLEVIARGGMGIVYKARQESLGRIVAVKMIGMGQFATDEDVQRFQGEAEAAAGLQHPNIVSIHEVGQHDGWHYFSMDYVAGQPLSALLRENLPPARKAAAYVRQMAEAIHYAHQQGTLHRDLKPSNVIIDEHDQVRITDFGLAMRVEGDSELTRTGQVLGTPSYMPPEQALSKRSLIGPASDVYALGAVLYECLTGRPPFRADSVVETIQQVVHNEPAPPRILNPIVPRDLETICLKCLEKEPARRYGSALELAEDLNRFLTGVPIHARPVGKVERAVRWCRRNPVLSALSAALLVLLAGIAAGTTVAYLREAELRADSDLARTNLEKSIADLNEEQQRSARLRTSVADLEQRRQALLKSVGESEARLVDGEERLFDTYLRLARVAWQADNIELADYYLNQCPPEHRATLAWRDLKRQCHPDVVTFAGQRCLALSDDGRMLAAPNGETINVWDAATRRLLRSLPVGGGQVIGLDFSPDGKWLAAAVGNGVSVWSIEDESVLRTLTGHTTPVTDVAFSPDGRRLASASYDRNRGGEVILWDAATFEPARTLPAVRFVVFSHDGRWLATGRPSGRFSTQLVVWDLSVSADSTEPHMAINSRIRPAFHPFQNELAVSTGSAVEFWDVERKQVVRRFTGELDVEVLAYSRNGKRLAYAGTTSLFAERPESFRAVIWNLITWERERTLPWYSSAVSSAMFSSDGWRLATADAGIVKLWDVTPPPDPTIAILDDIVDLDVGKYDWPQWGGSRARINTPAGKNIPASWDVGDRASLNAAHDWRSGRPPAGSKNIKWAVPLGSQTYGNPVVANGRIFLGSNNGAGYLTRYPSEVDLGVLLCFEEETGRFLWQHSNEKLPTGRVHDWPLQGVCSTAVVDGDRLWYVSNRGEVVCLDTEGFHDGEDDGVPLEAPAGDWVPVFQVPTKLHAHHELLRKAFAEAGVELPRYFRVTRAAEKNGWLLGAYERRGVRSEFVALYELQFDAGALRAYKLDAQGDRASNAEIFARDDALFPQLARGEIDELLRSEFLSAGVTLSESARLEPGAADGDWSISAKLFDRTRTFRLKLEGETLTCTKQLSTDDLDEADVVWKFNMMTELGVSQHNMANCSMITVDGMLLVCTSNGLDESHINLPAPDAPSFMALDRDTGRVIWTDNSPGRNILHAQWASPSYGVFNGQPQVIFPGGDGWVYSFDPQGDGRGGSKLLWKFDANPKTSRWVLGGRGTRNNVIAFPAIYDGLVYIVVGQDPEHGEGNGRLWCINPTKRTDGGDVSAELAVDRDGNVIPHRRLQAVELSAGERAVPNPDSAVVWSYSHRDTNGDDRFDFEECFHRSISIPVIKDDILYVADFSGLFHCLNAKTGKVYWTYDLLAACWTSALLVDGKVYVCDEDGDVTIFRHNADPRIAGVDGEFLGEYNMGNAIYMTPIVANNVLYIATKDTLYAIQNTPDGAGKTE
jgi:serine/threonine protein kinase/WD40 repeat protein